MSILRTLLGAMLFIPLLSSPSFSAQQLMMDEPLSLNQAVDLALSRNDPSIGTFLARAKSEQEYAIASGQLPDPKVKFGIANIATNSLKFSQEPMTQMQFGVHQDFPSAKKRALAREQGEAKGDAYRQMASGRALSLTLEVRKLWLQINFLETTATLVNSKKAKMGELLTAMEARFESGKSSGQKILSMEAELALLTDKHDELSQNIAKARVLLARYIGQANADRALKGGLDDLPLIKDKRLIEEGLNSHPVLLQEQAIIRASEKGVSLAKEQYKPNWGLDLGYGVRAGGRADMATAMVTFDVPLFTDKRQDKRLSASRQNKQAALLKKQALQMNMVRDLRASFTIWQKSGDRINLYKRVLLERTAAASKASENAYATGSIDFAEIIRTHLSELDVQMKLEAIRLDRASAQVELLYFEGADQ